MQENRKQIAARILEGPSQWQVFQRDADGVAEVTVSGEWWCDVPCTVEARVASEYDNTSAAGCEWQDAELLDDYKWRITFRVPTGGPYRIDTRLNVPGSDWRLAGESIWHIAVGDVWVIAGQSNAVGYGHGTAIDPPMLGVHVFACNEEWRLATHPIFDQSKSKHPANFDGGWIGMSPWLTFGKEILQNTNVPIGLIPAALGGSPLRFWDPGSGESYLYDNMVSMINAAGGKVAGMVWYQGCTDADSQETSSTYLDRFKRFVESFRSDFGAELPIVTAQINRVMDYTPTREVYWSVIREAQRQAPKVIPNLSVIPTLDLGLSDTIHNDAAANVKLGHRIAQSALSTVYGKNVAWEAADAEGACFEDDTRSSIRIKFTGGCGKLTFLAMKRPDFRIEDESGVVEIKSSAVENKSEVVLKLNRPAKGKTICHNMYGCDPECTLRDETLQPTLAFSVEVQYFTFYDRCHV